MRSYFDRLVDVGPPKSVTLPGDPSAEKSASSREGPAVKGSSKAEKVPGSDIKPGKKTNPAYRGEIHACPRRVLRPVWVLDVPAKKDEGQVYRIFDPRTATWKDQWQWVPLVKNAEGEDVPPVPSPESVPRKPRTPRNNADLKAQRGKEKDWDKLHGTVFSRNNQEFHPNYRSYFDRWKDDVAGIDQSREPKWRLNLEKKPLGKSRSDTVFRSQLPDDGPRGRVGWESNFSTRLPSEVARARERAPPIHGMITAPPGMSLSD